MSLESMQNINSRGQNNPEKNKGPWERVTEEALLLLDKNPDLSPQLKEEAKALINDPNFKKKIKDNWDEMTLRGNVKEPEEQERLWAIGLKERIIYELSAPGNK